jgi:hypothetical protein
MNLGDGLGELWQFVRNHRCDARGQCGTKDLEWTQFHGLLDLSSAANRDPGTYIATSRAMRMAT